MRIEPATGHQAQSIYQCDRGQSSNEGSDRHGPRTPGSSCYSDYRSQTGTARQTQEIWLRERVPDHGLEGRAADAEAAADEKSQHHSWSTQVADDRGSIGIGIPEAVPNRLEW